MATTLTESGSANFDWAQIRHPDLYGIGIELERTVVGYDADKKGNRLSDVTIILLPPTEEGSTPRVTVDNVPIQYGTLVTSLKDQKEARKRFGIETRNFVTDAKKVLFRTIGINDKNLGISLNSNRAVYFDQLNGSGYRLNMDNGFHHIKATWFSKNGQLANYNQNQLLSPQIYVDNAPPIDILQDKDFTFPVYKKARISSTEIFTDLASAYQFYWDVNQDGIPDQTGPEFVLPAQKEPKEITVNLLATVDIQDTNFKQYKKQFKVTIYTPEISLEEEPLKTDGTLKGTMKAQDPSHDLTDIPFSLFRKRWGLWKNLGLLKKRRNLPTTPPLSDKNTYKDNYYAVNKLGDYEISGFSKGPSNVIITDGTPKDVARVHLKTGQIEMLDKTYEPSAIPASMYLPTRVSIVKKNFDTVLANIYYVADSNTDVTIQNEPLHQNNLETIGVTIGDMNPNDSVIARSMPGFAESFPGGAAVFNEATQQNIALINSDGAVRMMRSKYTLGIKNPNQLSEKIIFQILDPNQKPIYDVFIAADMEHLKIKQDEIWNDIKIMIGYLKKKIEPMFASLIAQANTTPTKPSAPKSPFSDIDASHPNYKQILDLYQRRIVSGYGDGSFKPDAKISRAEFVKIALGATNCFDCSNPSETIINKYYGKAPFPDVSLPAWYYYCIAMAKELGMVTGYGDGFFKAERNISRAEAVAVLLRQSGIDLQETPDSYFLDVPEYAWYIDYVYTGVQVGLIPEKNGFVFPDEEITRGEFAFMASGVLDLQNCREVDSDKDGMPDWWEVENNLDPLFSGDADLDNDDDDFTNLQEYLSGTDPNRPDIETCPYVNNPNKSDTDKDGIFDVCDDDIDNDGVKNALGIFDDEGYVDLNKLKDSDDNCVFAANPDQKDSDGDGVGDACLFVDQCPKIPEDLDAYHDTDGCPELNDEVRKKEETSKQKAKKKAAEYYSQKPGVYVNRGPLCYFLDYENDFVEGDIIMTAITDVDTHETVYNQSNEVTFE